MFGRGWSAAALLLAAVAGPLVLFPHPLTLIPVGGLAAAGLLSLFVRPRRPRPAPTPEFALAAD
jgi:hypothetical protein